jgi:hypothetical protein
MNTTTEDALTRLRLADPAAHQTLHSADVSARTMLEQIVAAEPSSPNTDAPPNVRHLPVRRLAVGAAVAATVVAGGAIAMPWDHGTPGSAAYAVDRHADGTIDVSIKTADFTDPAGLNAQLAADGAHTVVMKVSDPGACDTALAVDPRVAQGFRVEPGQTVEEAAQAAMPWIDLHLDNKDPQVALYTIHPDQIPTGDSILIPFQYAPSVNGAGESAGAVLGTHVTLVTQVPDCVPAAP